MRRDGRDAGISLSILGQMKAEVNHLKVRLNKGVLFAIDFRTTKKQSYSGQSATIHLLNPI